MTTAWESPCPIFQQTVVFRCDSKARRSPRARASQNNIPFRCSVSRRAFETCARSKTFLSLRADIPTKMSPGVSARDACSPDKNFLHPNQYLSFGAQSQLSLSPKSACSLWHEDCNAHGRPSCWRLAIESVVLSNGGRGSSSHSESQIPLEESKNVPTNSSPSEHPAQEIIFLAKAFQIMCSPA